MEKAGRFVLLFRANRGGIWYTEDDLPPARRETTDPEMIFMTIQAYLPFWTKLTAAQQQTLEGAMRQKIVDAGALLHSGSAECTGLLLIKQGQLRAYILSDEGREVTIYRLFDRDMCLFSAACIMRSVQFDVIVEAEKDNRTLASFLVYILPVLLGVVGVIVGAQCFEQELYAALFCLAGLAVGFLAVWAAD